MLLLLVAVAVGAAGADQAGRDWQSSGSPASWPRVAAARWRISPGKLVAAELLLLLPIGKLLQFKPVHVFDRPPSRPSHLLLPASER